MVSRRANSCVAYCMATQVGKGGRILDRTQGCEGHFCRCQKRMSFGDMPSQNRTFVAVSGKLADSGAFGRLCQHPLSVSCRSDLPWQSPIVLVRRVARMEIGMSGYRIKSGDPLPGSGLLANHERGQKVMRLETVECTADLCAPRSDLTTPVPETRTARSVRKSPSADAPSALFPHRNRQAPAASSRGGFPTRADLAPSRYLTPRPASEILHRS